jgi:hypothetical protein
MVKARDDQSPWHETRSMSEKAKSWCVGGSGRNRLTVFGLGKAKILKLCQAVLCIAAISRPQASALRWEASLLNSTSSQERVNQLSKPL